MNGNNEGEILIYQTEDGSTLTRSLGFKPVYRTTRAKTQSAQRKNEHGILRRGYR